MSQDWTDYLTRAMRGATQGALADAAGVDQSTVSRWLRGTVVPAPETAIRLARRMRVEPLAALVAAGHLTASEAGASVTHTVPASLTDDELIDLVRDRLAQAREREHHDHPATEKPATQTGRRASRATARSDQQAPRPEPSQPPTADLQGPGQP